MNKKGFTLVELLAVIAILAILVIIALPNVLGTFNTAKKSTFVTEVQSIMDTATKSFMQDALTQGGAEICYAANATGVTASTVAGVKPLDMSGNEKSYFVKLDRYGNIVMLRVFDKNFNYTVTGTTAAPIVKTAIVDTAVTDAGTAANDSLTVFVSGTTQATTCATATTF